ncbi:S8 family serine peptidase [Luteimicrobium sp. DT211]|uniref:S8 family serine peptidase n=1 Tax=Luteimicrobium sp. DT211 TaxID=3393412 RepID=UPI003CEE01CB
MTTHHRRARGAAAALAAAALIATTAATAATAADTDGTSTTGAENATPTPTAPRTGTDAAFTLVTGDVVRARIAADGTVGDARIVSDDPDRIVSTWISGGDTYVIPAAAQPLIDAGTLDERLFDVSLLWRDGYDDASTPTLPVIVEYAGSASARSAVRGATTTTALPAIDGAAVAIDKDRATAAWAGLAPAQPGATSRAASTGVEKLWLDAKVHGSAVTDLAPTVPLTGAGTAHDLGYDGAGVKVAVLDTGYDQQHPDLAGQVAASKTFVTSSGATIQDGNGHGTHTASTIAGTGAASDGRYAGMAPGAQLLVGKVLGDDGSGQTSWILAGMQWAVDSGAKVVSMSLGDSSATACTGPDVDLVQALSDKALFVIAAGNEGLRGQVSTPGCAPDALTVGALDRDDKTAAFSSRGPAVGSSASKPDIASQGVQVVAARAGGGTDLPYVAESGTSMATPHVAGGAALVFEEHPDWSPEQVKDVLTSSADATTTPVLEQGAGPLDVGRAVQQPVWAAPSTQLASFRYPEAGQDPVTKTLTLHSTSDRDVTLDLSLQLYGDGGDADLPRGAVSFTDPVHPGQGNLGKGRVVVPAGGTVDVPLTIDPTAKVHADDYGTVTGRLVGADAHGVRLTVPFSYSLQGPTAQVTVVTKDRRGAAPDSFSSFQVLDLHGGVGASYAVGTGTKTFTMPVGSYDFSGVILTRDTADDHGQVDSVTQVFEHAVKVSGDTTVVLDARDARELSWKTDKPTEAQGYSIGFTEGFASDGTFKTGLLTTVPAYVKHLYTTATKADDRFTFEATARLAAPRLTLTSSGGHTVDDLPVSFAPEFGGTSSAPLVDVGPGTDANLAAADVAGKIVLVDAASVNAGGNSLSWDRALKGRGAVGLIAYSSAAKGRIVTSGTGVSLPMVTITADDAAALKTELAAGPVTMHWAGQPVSTSPYVYNVATVTQGKVPTGVQRVHDKDLATVPTQYYTQGLDSSLNYLDLGLELPGVSSVYASGSMLPVRGPLDRTEYYTASSDVHWTTVVRMTPNLASAASYDGPRTYTPGSTSPTSWFRTPTGASGNTNDVPVAWRELNGLSLTVPTWGDAAGHDSTALANADSAFYKVSVDGAAAIPVGGVYAVPAASSTVHLQQQFTRRSTLATLLGLAYTTDWTFTTDRSRQGAQSLLIPQVDVDTDLTGRVPAGSDAHVVLGASDDETATPADVTAATLEYATGPATTTTTVTGWTSAPLTRDAQGRWTATIPNDVPTGTFVHLRVSLTDAHGSHVEQTMVRVYQVGGRIDLGVSARSQCVNGHAAVAVYAANRGDVAADVTLSTPFGSATVAGVPSGKAAYHLFDTGSARLRAGGTADVVGKGHVGTLDVTTPYRAAYDAVSCKG